MDVEALEVYSRDTNYAVIKPSGRRFPGVVIQGDSFSHLVRRANNIARLAAQKQTDCEEFIDSVEELNDAMVERILHYQEVLQRHGIELPYGQPFTEEQLIDKEVDGELD